MKKCILILLMFMVTLGISQSRDYLMILNNLGKTASVLDLQTGIMDTNFMTIDPTAGYSSPNDILVIHDTLYVISSITDMIRMFDISITDPGQRLLKSEQLLSNGNATNPNAMTLARDSLLFITLGISEEVRVLNRKNLDSIASIPVSYGPQAIKTIGDSVFVASSGVSYTDWSTHTPWLHIIDVKTLQKVDSVALPEYNLTGIELWNQDTLLLLCSGQYMGNSSALYWYKISTREFVDSLKANGQLFSFGYDVQKRNIFIGPWGEFNVINGISKDTLAFSLKGGSGFYFYNNYTYTCDFNTDSLLVYDSNYKIFQKYPVGDGPNKIIYFQSSNVLDIDTEESSIPIGFQLAQNYPNPFNPSTTIEFGIPQASYVNLFIYNALGQKIKTLLSEQLAPGKHSVKWDGKDDSGKIVPSGIYFYQLRANNITITRKMIYTR